MFRPTLTFLALALASGAVLAQTPGPTTTPAPTAQTGVAPAQITPAPAAEFDDLDRNRDGFVARDEVPVTHAGSQDLLFVAAGWAEDVFHDRVVQPLA